jgi:hypothetical protein
MMRTLVAGALLAVCGALTIALGAALGLDLDHVALLGVTLGAVIGLVPDRTPVFKVVGFLGGLFAAWVSYGLRAAVLPDTSAGRAVAVFVAIALCVAVVLVSMRRVPLWSTLVGAAALAGAYEATYTAAPSQFMHESPTALTTVVLAAAVGHLAMTLLGPDSRPKDPEAQAAPATATATPTATHAAEHQPVAGA